MDKKTLTTNLQRCCMEW